MSIRISAALTLLLALAAPAPLRAADDAKKEQKPWHEGLTIKPEKVGETAASTTFGGRIFFGAQPKEGDFKAYAEKGVKVVINLRPEDEMKTVKFDEKGAVEAVGLKYLQFPVGHKDPPTDAELEKLMNALDGAKEQPVLLHCASSNRVGYVWAMYRGTRHGLSEEAALAEGKAAGLHAPPLAEAAKKYIERKAPEAKPAKEAPKK